MNFAPPLPTPALPVGHPDRITGIDRLAYGTGFLAESLSKQTAQQMVSPFYNLCLGVNPTVLGLMLAAARLYESASDLLVGHLSDNARFRWGRRRPYMAVGTVCLAVFFVLLWLPSAGWSLAAIVAYFLLASVFYGTAHSVFSVPLASLGFELTPDYHERTRLMAVRSLLMPLASIFSVWAFALAQWPVFGGAVAGTRWVAAGIAVATLACGFWPVLALRERNLAQTAAQPHVSLRASLRSCARSRPNLLLCGAVFWLLIGAITAESLRLYVCIYYVCGGDMKAGAILTGLLGTAYQVVSLIVVPFITRWSIRVGKGRALEHCLALGAAGAALQWWCYDPRIPYLALVPNVVTGAGLAGMWLLSPSMLADICDHDALASGVRREGMFAAVWSWTLKIAVMLAALAGGIILDLSGFDMRQGAVQSPEALWRLRCVFSWLPVLSLGLSGWLVRRYPLDETTMRTVRAQLAER